MKAMHRRFITLALVSMAGCSSPSNPAICCDGGYEYRHRAQWDAEKAARQAAAEAAAKLAALERDRQMLRDEVAALTKESASARGRSHDLEQQLSQRDAELAALRSAAAGDSARLASRLAESERSLERAQTTIGDLEGQLAAARSEAEKNPALRADLDAAQQRASALEAQLQAARSEAAALHTASGEKDQLSADLAASKRQIAALEARLAEQDQLMAELASARQRAGSLESDLAGLQGMSGQKEKLAADLASANEHIADLERQLADRDRQLASLRGDLSAEMAKLKEAQRGLMKALRPQIDKGNITVDLNNERLLINLASGYLFGSGEDQLSPAGTEALKHVGSILKDYPEYKVAVDGHTDNRPIRSALKKRFPTNKELSEARARNAALALTEGGVTAAETHGYADSRPVMPNATDAGRAKNRRVEVRITK